MVHLSILELDKSITCCGYCNRSIQPSPLLKNKNLIFDPSHSNKEKLIEHLPTAINENRKLPHHPKRQALKTCNCMAGINIKNNLVYNAVFLRTLLPPCDHILCFVPRAL